MPSVASQKCQLIMRSEYIRSRFHKRGTRKYTQAKVIMPFHPSAPEWTWPMVQSV